MVVFHGISWDLPSGIDEQFAIEPGHKYIEIVSFPTKNGDVPKLYSLPEGMDIDYTDKA